jgi:hypothetical protein
MRSATIWAVAALFAILTTGTTGRAGEPKLADAPPPPVGFPKFKWQEIDTALKIGYAVILEDLNGDKKSDVVVVDQHKVVWYENPTWKKRVILDGKTKPDNVCICALDIDGGGDLELVIGAGWKPFDTKNPGTLQWLKRGKSLDDEWTMHPIACDEPTVHRVQAFDVNGDGKKEIVMAPLMGRDATRERNWLDGRPVRVLGYAIPADPKKSGNWKPTVLSDTLHVVHNFCPVGTEYPTALFATASYEGISLVDYNDGKYSTRLYHQGNQKDKKGSRGASEIARGTMAVLGSTLATVQPWHGNELVLNFYNDFAKSPVHMVLDNKLRWGHAVKFANFANEPGDTVVLGVRDDPNPKLGDTFTDRRGIRLYQPKGSAREWDRYVLEDGGVAVEDLAVGDLNGDGKPDIVAVGRATGNCRIYWNQGK